MVVTDSLGRKIRKLRLSLLDACQFRCFYCMPKQVKFMPPKQYLTPEQIESLCKQLVQFGIDQIRLTGGEPTLRKEFHDIVLKLSRLQLNKLALTTNGYYLEEHLDFLKKTECRSINISLDSLKEDKFNQLVNFKAFHKVMKALLKTKEMGFRLKLNTVLLKGFNDDEIFDFINFSSKYHIEVRFLELMKIGQVLKFSQNHFISASEVIQRINQHEKLIPEKVEWDSTSFNFRTPQGAQIGFIASESEPFCHSCSRLRLSADGYLRACLMSERGIPLKPLLNEKTLLSYDDFIKVIQMKPLTRIEKIHQDMHQIGG